MFDNETIMSKLKKLLAQLISHCSTHDNNHNIHKSKRVGWRWVLAQGTRVLFVINFPLVLYKVFEKNILSVSAERQKELETLQEIITSLTLQLRERDQQIEELKQSLKGN